MEQKSKKNGTEIELTWNKIKPTWKEYRTKTKQTWNENKRHTEQT